MAKFGVTYGLIDAYSHKGYKGFTLGASVSAADVTTFLTGLSSYSDAEPFSAAVEEKNAIAYDLLLAGTHGVEFQGSILLEGPDGHVYPVTIPAIVEASIDWNGTGQAKVLAATEAAVAALFTTLTGIAVTVKSSEVNTPRRKR